MKRAPIILILLALVAWGIFGEPKKNVANLFWSSDAAPWETVDAFYYPDCSNLMDYRSTRSLTSVGDCRSWVNTMAAANNDPGLLRGDYECGVGKMDDLGDIAVYRLTVR